MGRASGGGRMACVIHKCNVVYAKQLNVFSSAAMATAELN